MFNVKLLVDVVCAEAFDVVRCPKHRHRLKIYDLSVCRCTDGADLLGLVELRRILQICHSRIRLEGVLILEVSETISQELKGTLLTLLGLCLHNPDEWYY